jgi:uncharacterized protein DUF222
VVEQVIEPTEVPLERLEAEICQGAAHLFAGMARWLLLVGEFDRRQGYAHWECRSSAYWLNWHCGISMRTGHEQVRVARALLEYPAIAAVFCRGELSYSKVRAITRVVTPATEAQLLEWAPHATAAQLERIVAGHRRVTRHETGQSHAARHVSALTDDDGSLVGTFRLDADEGAAFLAALTLGKDLLRAERSAERTAAERSAERTEEKRSAERSLDDCSPEPLRPAVANASARDGDEVVEHRPADASFPRRLCGVHRLQLGMELVEVRQRSEPDKLTVLADAEERHVVRTKSCDVECMHILGGLCRFAKARCFSRSARTSADSGSSIPTTNSPIGACRA